MAIRRASDGSGNVVADITTTDGRNEKLGAPVVALVSPTGTLLGDANGIAVQTASAASSWAYDAAGITSTTGPVYANLQGYTGT